MPGTVKFLLIHYLGDKELKTLCSQIQFYVLLLHAQVGSFILLLMLKVVKIILIYFNSELIYSFFHQVELNAHISLMLESYSKKSNSSSNFSKFLFIV